MVTRTILALLFCAALAALQPIYGQSTPYATVERGAMDPAVSPDGTRIAASILGKIWVMPIEGGDAVQVSTGPGWDRRPAWSSDGRFLAYAHAGQSGTDIVVRNLESGALRFVHHTNAGIGHIEFGPEGSGIFFVEERSQYDAHLWQVALDGTEPTQLTHTQGWHEWSFALSPGGDSVLIESGQWGGADLYMLQLPELEVERLTKTDANEFSVAWSSDGRRRVFVRGDNGIDAVMVKTGDEAPRSVFESPYDQKQIALLPSGNAAVLAAGRRLYRLDLDTGDRQSIPFTARAPAAPTSATDLAITNARFLDVRTGQVREGVTVLVQDGKVVAAGEGVFIPFGTTLIDANGQTLMPGLMDNHQHFWSASQGGRLIARGVTSIRDPGVAISESMNFKDAIALGLLTGPRIFTTGPLIDGEHGYHPMVDVTLRTPEHAAAVVRSLQEQGVDALKAYFMLDPDVLRAVVAEARRLGIPVTGHIGVRASWGDAIDAGINGFSHVRIWRDVLPLDRQPQGLDESLASNRNRTARMQADWREIDPDGAAVQALIDRMVERGTAIDPTLRIQRFDDGSRSRFSLELFAAGKDSYERMGRFVRNAQRAGVPLLAGTDNINLIDELEAYAEFGIPNLEIIRAATVNGARWLGREDEFGTLEVGTRADLILVDGDPLSDVGALRNISLVAQNGLVVFRR